MAMMTTGKQFVKVPLKPFSAVCWAHDLELEGVQSDGLWIGVALIGDLKRGGNGVHSPSRKKNAEMEQTRPKFASMLQLQLENSSSSIELLQNQLHPHTTQMLTTSAASLKWSLVTTGSLFAAANSSARLVSRFMKRM